MTLPTLYVEGLSQRALRGQQQLNSYKLDLIEAILKEGLRGDGGEDATALRRTVQTALNVARWDPRRHVPADRSLGDSPEPPAEWLTGE